MCLAENSIGCIKKFLCKLHGISNDHNYSPSLHTLFSVPHVTNRNDQNTINLLWTLLEDLKNIMEGSDVLPMKIKQWMDYKRQTRDIDTQTDSKHEMIDQKFVQVTCDNTEVNRRINAFIKRKRAERDAFNRHEFCVFREDRGVKNSCARTDAVLVPRQSEKSLVKIRRITNNEVKRKDRVPVKNHNLQSWPPLHPSSSLAYYKLPTNTKERVNKLTSVVDPNKNIKNDTDIYKHIKELESKVLFLETLSPEYFSITTSIQKENYDSELKKDSFDISNNDKVEDEEDLDLIDIRIQELRERLYNQGRSLEK